MGVTVETISPGDGKNFPVKGDNVQIHYVGTLQTNGSKFDSSRDRGKPFQCKIGVGQVRLYFLFQISTLVNIYISHMIL